MCDAFGRLGRIIVLLLTAAGVVLQVFAAGDCEFLMYSNSNNQDGTIGLFQFQIPGSTSCVEWPEELLTGIEKFARFSILFSLICAGIAFIFIAFECIIMRVPCAGCLRSIAYACAKMFALLAYVIFATENCVTTWKCQMGQGAYYNLAAFCAYFLSGIVLCCTPTPDPCLCGK